MKKRELKRRLLVALACLGMLGTKRNRGSSRVRPAATAQRQF